MKTLGNEIFIQRGELWSLDFEVTNKKGDPFMSFEQWKNEYLVITITAARYEQKDNFRQSWWLDLNNRWVEKEDGSFVIIPMKKFVGTEALYTESHTIEDILAIYTKITANGDVTSSFDITKYLFFVDDDANNKRIYKYLKEYTLDNEGNILTEEWEEYNFRIIKQFDTKDWIERNYLFDMKIVSGESLQEHVHGLLLQEELPELPSLPWTNAILQKQINLITDTEKRNELQNLFNEGVPLMPSFDTNSVIVGPTKLTVGTDIMGGK